MRLTRSQRVLLDFIGRRTGVVNWYQLGRACLSRLDSPADFKLGSLLDLGLIEESPCGDEPLGRLWITEEGVKLLADYAAEPADP